MNYCQAKILDEFLPADLHTQSTTVSPNRNTFPSTLKNLIKLEVSRPRF